MNGIQINQLNMMDAVNQVLTSFNSSWNTNAAINGMVVTFRSHLTALNANDTLQKTLSTGVTQTKENAKAAMINAAILTANAGRAYAAVTSNANLLAQMSYTSSDLKRATDTDADDICQLIHDNLNPYIANISAYGATTATQTALQNAITAFSNLIGTPRQQKAIVVHATITIAQHFSAANALLKDQLDAALIQFKASNAAFYNQYMSARVIVDAGHRHTVTLRGFVYGSDNTALAGATVSLTGDDSRHKVTDATGAYTFTRLHTGSYTLTVSANGYATQSQTIDVPENDTVETDFSLVGKG